MCVHVGVRQSVSGRLIVLPTFDRITRVISCSSIIMCFFKLFAYFIVSLIYCFMESGVKWIY
jgi:hypothetical protein